MKALWMTVGAAMLFALPASAAQMTKQTNHRTRNEPEPSQQVQQQGENAQKTGYISENATQRLSDNLQQSGFTKVQIVPQSFLIRARDPDGNPIVMVVSPDVVAGVTAMQEGGGAGFGRSVGIQPAARFVRGPVHDAMDSNLEGTTVQSSDNQDVGSIKGIVIGDNGSLSYLLGLKNGQDVAVDANAISVSYNPNDGNWNAKIDATANQIASAPRAEINEEK